MTIRKSTPQDISNIMEIYAYARASMRESGNPNQWFDNHPPKSLVEADIHGGNSYVCVNENEILAVFHFNIEEEPTYSKISGQWLNDKPYGVIHRIARGPTGKGAGANAINWCLAQHHNIRIDTHKDNIPMLRLLDRLGFAYCGVIWLDNGDERLAFHMSEDATRRIRQTT